MIFKNLKTKKLNSGFTLVELLIYMGMLTGIILVFTEIFVSIAENQLQSENTSNVANDGRYIYSRLIYDINRADAIVEPEDFGDTSNQLILTIDGENFTYSLSSENLSVTNDSGVHRLNSYGTKISNIEFTKIGTLTTAPTVQLRFTVSGIIKDTGIDSQVFQTTAGLR